MCRNLLQSTLEVGVGLGLVVACSTTTVTGGSDSLGGTAGLEGLAGAGAVANAQGGSAGMTVLGGNAGDVSVAHGGAGGQSGQCTLNENRCGGAEIELIAQTCRTDGSGFDDKSFCSDASERCNPMTGECMKIVIDATEVTRKAYATFLASKPGTSAQPAGCLQWNTSFEPVADCLSQGKAAGRVCDESKGNCDDHPQVCVDWCDATAYCAARGQHLCGRIGAAAKMNPFDRFSDPGSSEWMNGCSAAGQYLYAAGSSIAIGPRSCTYDGTQIGTTYPVKGRPDCVSPSPGYQALYDLSGNVAEWENSCERDATEATSSDRDACRTRGGSFESPLNELTCAVVPASAARRATVLPSIGFRCCG